MKGTFITAALLVGLVPMVGLAKDEGNGSAGRRTVTLQGCVIPGLEKGTAALTSVTEIAQAGQSVMPAEAHGRQVVFWLTPDDQIIQHVGQRVEVHGQTTKIEKSEIELKEGHQKSGGLVAKFEGPGKDVKVPNDQVSNAVGTAGRVKGGGDDVKTFLIRVKVDEVQRVEGTCP